MLFKLFQIIGKNGNQSEIFSVLSNSPCQKLNKVAHKAHKSITLIHEVTKPSYIPLSNLLEQYTICIT